MRMVIPGDVTNATGLTWEELLSRVPPFGWHGGDSSSGQLIAEGDMIAVVVDRVQSFPAGVLIALAFHTGDEDLVRRLQGLPTHEQMRARFLDMQRRVERDPVPAGRVSSMTATYIMERHPEASITVAIDGGPALRKLSGGDLTASSPTETVVFEHVSHRRVPPGVTVSLWLRPVLTTGDRLSVSVAWPEAGMPGGSVDLDLAAIRAAADRARQVYTVEWDSRPAGGCG